MGHGPRISIDIWVHAMGGLALCHNRLSSTVPADPATPESLQSHPLATLVALFLQFVHTHWLGHSCSLVGMLHRLSECCTVCQNAAPSVTMLHRLSPSVTMLHRLSQCFTVCHSLSECCTVCQNAVPSVPVCHNAAPSV